MNNIERLIILKIFRPDTVLRNLNKFIIEDFGEEFIKAPPFDIEKSYADSSTSLPLIFLLPGTDPMSLIVPFAEKNKKLETLKHVSLGQAQDKFAESAIEEALKQGGWVVLENCH